MSTVEANEQKILDSLDRLSPRGRREAIRRLVAGASDLDRLIEENRPRIESLARKRGLDWSSLPDEERERLVDEILHE